MGQIVVPFLNGNYMNTIKFFNINMRNKLDTPKHYQVYKHDIC